MNKDKKFKVLGIVSLIVAVIGLTLGFAAYTSLIKFNTFKPIQRSEDSDYEFTNKINFINDATCEVKGEATVTPGSAIGDTWNGITATFKNPKDEIKCEATIRNDSVYTAYLTNITSFDKVITCSGKATNKDEICKEISLELEAFGGSEFEIENNKATYKPGKKSTWIYPKSTKKIELEIDYTEKDEKPNGDMQITIPTIKLIFSTAQAR